eukprot:gnl/MRDRNA2_/MRDRNA2_110332_c0_seq1.p1 gnl/MRDRNA2_/MRDRNA2_110332_c0~~gnl/MRDRNA2_/MRDRNA2_110332_c0_seq1.p1  ORF type:complete len:473 (+),score=105.41 gnl/MRDRNA2_/MRDRNA2_110332_c0_seq1:124-1542(+)
MPGSDIYEKYGQNGKTPAHWNAATGGNLSSAQRAHKMADEQFQMSQMSHFATRCDNIKNYQNVHNNFQRKVHATKQLKDLLQERIKSVTGSINLTKSSLAMLQNKSQAKIAPLQLCTWRQEQRSQRPQREMIRDPVEIALEEEKDVLIDSQNSLNKSAEKTQAMIKLLKSWLEELEFDHQNKNHAYDVDNKCTNTMHKTWPTSGGVKDSRGAATYLSMTPRSGSLNGSAVPALMATNLSLPPIDASGALDMSYGQHLDHMNAAMHMDQEEKRQQETLTRIHKAKEAERAALALREDSDCNIERTDKECNFALNHVEKALGKRLEETQEMRRQLEKAINGTKQKISVMMHSMSLTGAEMQSHEEPTNLNTTRDTFRGGRTRRENIGDPVTTAMNRHHASLTHNYNVLDNCKSNETQCLMTLQKAKSDLEADLSDKTKAMNIDLTCAHKKNFQTKMTFDAMKPHLTRYPPSRGR